MNSKNLNKIILIFSLIVFLVIGFMVRNSSEGILFDVKILEYLQNHPNPVLFVIMKTISFIGSEMFLFPAMGIIIIYTLIKKRFYLSKLLLVSSLGSWLLNHLLKQIFQRTRPLDYILVKQGGLSYPSGHSMVTITMYLTIAYLLSKKFPQNKSLIYTLSIIYILLMGISRMYLGVHWPTDIIGGYLAGYIFYYFYINMIKE